MTKADIEICLRNKHPVCTVVGGFVEYSGTVNAIFGDRVQLRCTSIEGVVYYPDIDQRDLICSHGSLRLVLSRLMRDYE